MNEPLLATLGLGFVLGLKHATEADHLAAVSTIVSEKRSVWQSAAVGALWGMGHTMSLLVAGFVVIALGVAIPERVANFLELLVALMIIFLGTRLLYAVLRAQPDLHIPASAGRPVVVGIVHGLAGSAALTLLVLSEVVRNGSAMLLMSSLIGLPISLGVQFFQHTLVPMRVLAGIASTAFGLFYALRIVEKLTA